MTGPDCSVWATLVKTTLGEKCRWFPASENRSKVVSVYTPKEKDKSNEEVPSLGLQLNSNSEMTLSRVSGQCQKCLLGLFKPESGFDRCKLWTE